MNLEALIDGLHGSRGVQHKRDIAAVVQDLGLSGDSSIAVGDDCAAIPDGEGWSLLAMEGFQPEFVARDPWFAGWCAVMVNVADVYAMGGRPTALVNALWSGDAPSCRQMLAGMAAAARTYRVPIVGGHSNTRAEAPYLAAAILGRARRLLTSFDARPGDALVVAIDLRGAYRKPFPHWNCTEQAPAERLCGDLELLPQLAESGRCRAAKDISQAGVLGSLLMLLEGSGLGAVVQPAAVPRPPEVEAQTWLLSTFPSYGFCLAVAPQHVAAVIDTFQQRDLACAAIGHCDDSRRLTLVHGEQRLPAWDLRESPLTGCTRGAIHA